MNEPSCVAAGNCPLCGQPNRCAMQAQRGSGTPPLACWCAQVDFSQELLAKVPQEALGRACICPACAVGTSPV